jgi:hypothetical protein
MTVVSVARQEGMMCLGRFQLQFMGSQVIVLFLITHLALPFNLYEMVVCVVCV